MRRLALWSVVVPLALAAAACRSLPKMEDVKPARTHVQTLAFTAPDDGMMDAKALLVIHNESLVGVVIEAIDLTLMRGSDKVAVARDDRKHWIKAGYSDDVWVTFRDIPIADLEKVIGRKLTSRDAEKFEFLGTITYKTKEGPMQHPLTVPGISTVLGPTGSE